MRVPPCNMGGAYAVPGNVACYQTAGCKGRPNLGENRTTISPFIFDRHLHAVMKPIMATAIAPTVAATATATEPAPKKWSRHSREGIVVRTIKVDFDQSAELSDLISRCMDQQRWAFNMAIKEKLNDPRVTKYDLDGMLTKWRDEETWLVHDKEVLAAGHREACDTRVQRTGLRQGLDAVEKFMISNGRKRSNKSLWKYLARLYREREGVKDIDTAPNLPSNK